MVYVYFKKNDSRERAVKNKKLNFMKINRNFSQERALKSSTFKNLQFAITLKSNENKAALGCIQASISEVIKSKGMIPVGRWCCWQSKALAGGFSVFSTYHEYDFYHKFAERLRTREYVFYRDRVVDHNWVLDIDSFQLMFKERLEKSLNVEVKVDLLDCRAGVDAVGKDSFFVAKNEEKVETNFFRQLGDMHHRFYTDLSDQSVEPVARAKNFRKELVKNKKLIIKNASDEVYFNDKFLKQFREDFVQPYLDFYATPWSDNYLTWHSRRYLKPDRESWKKKKRK